MANKTNLFIWLFEGMFVGRLFLFDNQSIINCSIVNDLDLLSQTAKLFMITIYSSVKDKCLTTNIYVLRWEYALPQQIYRYFSLFSNSITDLSIGVSSPLNWPPFTSALDCMNPSSLIWPQPSILFSLFSNFVADLKASGCYSLLFCIVGIWSFFRYRSRK